MCRSLYKASCVQLMQMFVRLAGMHLNSHDVWHKLNVCVCVFAIISPETQNLIHICVLRFSARRHYLLRLRLQTSTKCRSCLPLSVCVFSREYRRCDTAFPYILPDLGIICVCLLSALCVGLRWESSVFRVLSHTHTHTIVWTNTYIAIQIIVQRCLRLPAELNYSIIAYILNLGCRSFNIEPEWSPAGHDGTFACGHQMVLWTA